MVDKKSEQSRKSSRRELMKRWSASMQRETKDGVPRAVEMWEQSFLGCVVFDLKAAYERKHIALAKYVSDHEPDMGTKRPKIE